MAKPNRIESMRLFIGVWLSDTILDEVMDLIDLARKENIGWKWTERQSLHFTLKFLGEIPEQRIDKLTSALNSAAAQASPFLLRLGLPGFFPRYGVPRIAWLGVSLGEQELVRIAGLVENNCLERGFEKADKPFQPHLTIARANKRNETCGNNSSKGVIELGDSISSRIHFESTMLVDSFSLIESSLYSNGAVYKTLQNFRLETRC